jgi:hypothetical protein
MNKKKAHLKGGLFFRETLGEATKKSYFHNLTHTHIIIATSVPTI